MPSRRLEDRIRELCAKLPHTPERESLPLIRELRVALSEHARRLENMAKLKLVDKLPFMNRRKGPPAA